LNIGGGHVSFGDASKVRVEGEDNILIKLKDETQKFISSVYYVPKMNSNILNLGQLLERGNDFESYNVSCIVVFSIVSCIVSNRLRYAKLFYKLSNIASYK
jgi:hypothetical protein